MAPDPSLGNQRSPRTDCAGDKLLPEGRRQGRDCLARRGCRANPPAAVRQCSVRRPIQPTATSAVIACLAQRLPANRGTLRAVAKGVRTPWTQGSPSAAKTLWAVLDRGSWCCRARKRLAPEPSAVAEGLEPCVACRRAGGCHAQQPACQPSLLARQSRAKHARQVIRARMPCRGRAGMAPAQRSQAPKGLRPVGSLRTRRRAAAPRRGLGSSQPACHGTAGG